MILDAIRHEELQTWAVRVDWQPGKIFYVDSMAGAEEEIREQCRPKPLLGEMYMTPDERPDPPRKEE